MTKYKILKGFQSPVSSNDFKLGESVDTDTGYVWLGSEKDGIFAALFTESLVKKGFIEEIQDEIWSRGVKLENTNLCWSVLPDSQPWETDLDGYEPGSGLIFNTEAEAEAYAEHLRLENEIINEGVKAGGKTKMSVNYDRCPCFTSEKLHMKDLEFPYLWFALNMSASNFVANQNVKPLIEKYLSYYIESEE